jgi:hypothetical protein
MAQIGMGQVGLRGQGVAGATYIVEAGLTRQWAPPLDLDL